MNIGATLADLFFGLVGLDGVIELFEMIKDQNKRTYPAPDLYMGEKTINKEFSREALEAIMLQT